MLSILIPIYAFDVNLFVRELHRQASLLSMNWEIILFDDGSPKHWKSLNSPLRDLENTTYKELDENIGRAAIRNALAKAAKFDYLLFMDCDSEVVSSHFLQNYICELKPNVVLYGGRSYTSLPPTEQGWLLHWEYGRKREVRSVEERKQNAYHGFMTNNFVMPRDLFLRIQLDDRLKQYGHEDTLLGLKLEREGVSIIHLDNPLLHIGLEKANVWLEKQKQAIQNLYWLHGEYPTMSTPALDTWKILEKTKLYLLVLPLLKMLEDRIEKHLCTSRKPKLWLFDTLKILWLGEV